MNRLAHIISLTVFIACEQALAAWTVTQHNGNIPNDNNRYWVADPQTRRIFIRDSIALQPFRFSVSDTSDPNGLGTVEAILPQTTTRLASVTIEIIGNITIGGNLNGSISGVGA